MNDNVNLSFLAELFIKNLFKVYLEDRNFPLLISMLHKDITWFGTGEQEVCRNHKDAIKLLEMESTSWNGKFKFTNQWYSSLQLTEDKFIVFGEIHMVEDGLNTFLLEMKTRVSAVCVLENGEMKLYHAHLSVPNQAQKENEFVHKKVIKNYNILLEEKLQERTKMLKAKTVELETLTNNIYGGVQICRYDDEFTIEYISDGFTTLTGYTKDELTTLFENKHLRIVHPSDISILTDILVKQLKTDNSFSVEYRIIRKDGKIIWVMDKGVLIQNEGDTYKIQCILTDITARKEQEETLKLSEKRYEIAMNSSGITMFEYNVVTKDLILYEADADKYAVSTVIPNGVETFVKKGIIEPESANDYIEMYQKIHAGALTARCNVKTRDRHGIVLDYELSLTNVFDSDGNPVRAIGVRTNISHMLGLQKEQEFGKNLVANKILIFEADITTNKIEYLSKDWEGAHFVGLNPSFTQLVDLVANKYVFKEHKELFLKKLSIDYIKKVLDDDSSLFTFKFKYFHNNRGYLWYEATVNIIKDNRTGNIRIRYYYVDINKQKLKEIKAVEEKQLYQAMIAKAILAYEVNISRNLAIEGHENWNEKYNINKSSNYTIMIKEFSKKAVHPDDSKMFYEIFCRENVLKSFQSGNRQIKCEYRKIYNNNEYKWVNCILHLYEDIQTNDIKGFSYVEDIDDEKRAKIALKYDAEHDVMTEMYNKTVTEQKITHYINSQEGKHGHHALLIIDIDYFKYVNDNFGHLFGDGVIKEIALKIRSLSRDNDIVGRIGGDEFCLFMKNISKNSDAMKKAQSICEKIKKTYKKDGKSCTISASVGIAIYKEHGTNYLQLCISADKSLYLAKENGKDRYEMSC